MKITQVTYERRLTDGNYGNRLISLVADLDETDNPQDALASLRTTVHTQLVRDADEEEQARTRRAQEDAARYQADRYQADQARYQESAT